MLDILDSLIYNSEVVRSQTKNKTKSAAIAQQVERILGKDEVSSSNLDSSSKALKLLEFRGFFLFSGRKPDRILFHTIS